MAERPLYTLYKNLKAQDFDVPDDYDQFENVLTRQGKTSAANRHKIYENLKAQNFDVPDSYDKFYTALFQVESKNTSRAKGGYAPMSNRDKLRFMANAKDISKQAGVTMKKAGQDRYNTLKNRQEKRKKDFGRVTIGTNQNPYGGDASNVVKDDFVYNPETGKAGTYLTSDKEESYSLAEAQQRQAGLDSYIDAVDTGQIASVFDVRDKKGNYDLQENVGVERTYVNEKGQLVKSGKDDTYVTKEGLAKQLDAKLRSAYSERDRLNEMARKRMEEIDNREHQGFNDFMMMSNAASSAGGGLVGESEMANRKYENDDTYRNIMTALRQNKATITTLEDEKTNQLNGFWHTLGTTIGNGYTFTDGMGVFNDVTSLMQAKKHLDSINEKKAKGLPLSDKEKVLESVLNNTAINNVVQTMYGGDYGAWARAGATTAQSLDFMKEIMEFPGAATIAKNTASKVAGIGAKQLAKKAGENAVKAFAKKSARGFMKATGMLVGSHVAGAAISNTTGLGTTMGLVGQGMAGTVDKEKGNYVFRDAQKFIPSLIEAERNQIGENGSEMFGEFLPGGKEIVKGLGDIGLSKIANYLTAIGNKQWYKQYYNLAKAGGYNGLLGEGLEEYEGMLYDALTGHAGDTWNQLKDPQTHIDIWLGVGSMSVLLGAVPMAIQGTQTVGYFKFKNKLNHSDNAAYMAFGSNDSEKWEKLREKIDNTPNDKISRFAAGIAASRDTMTKDQIDATLNYIKNLVKYRTFNIAEISNANETADDDPDGLKKEKNQQIGNAYSEGQDAEDADKHNIQMEAEDQMTTLANKLGITEQQLSAISDEELEAMTGQDDKLDKAIYDYQLSTARYQGVIDNAQDKVDQAVLQAEQETDMLTDKSRGTVRNATIKATQGKEDYNVYIISGNIATNEDGSINVSESDDMILYFDPTTKTVEHADALRFAALGSEENADEVKARVVAEAKEKAIKEVAGIIDGTVGEGYQFTTTDENGIEHTYEILSDNGDGTAMVTIDGNVDQNPHTFEELQQLKDIEDQNRLEAAKAEREQMEAERGKQNQQPNVQTNETVPPIDFDKITNNDGNIVMVDVVDENGNTLYDGSQLFLISSDGVKAKVMEMDEDGNLKPHAVDKSKIVVGETMPLDEYKQAFSGSSELEEDGGSGNNSVEEESQPIRQGVFGNINRSKDEKGITTNPTSASHGVSEPELAALNDSVGKVSSDVTLAAPNINEGSRAVAPDETSVGKDSNNSSNDNEEKQTLTLSDGTVVPTLEDGNPDFSQLTAGQTAELYDAQFGEDAEQLVSGFVSDAKKALDKASNMKVKGNSFVEQKESKAAKDKAIADAQAKYDSAVAIRDAYNELMLNKALETHEGRMSLIDKAKNKFARLKNKDEWKNQTQALWNETVGAVLHRLYDGLGTNVFDNEPQTLEEYVGSLLKPFSLNYEGSENGKGVKQETGMERSNFTKSKILAKEGSGETVDSFVHRLWENRPTQFENATDQDIRNAVLDLITSDMNAYDMSHVIENNRIAQAEKEIEDRKFAEENAAPVEETKPTEIPASEQESQEEANNEEVSSDENVAPAETETEEGASEGLPFKPSDDGDAPFSVRDKEDVSQDKGGKSQYNRSEDIEKNRVDDIQVVDSIVGRKMRKSFDRLAKMMGAKIQWQYSDKLGNGWYDSETNTIYLTLDSSLTRGYGVKNVNLNDVRDVAQKGAQFIFGHEMTHEIKRRNEAAYNELKSIISKAYGEELQKAIDDKRKEYVDLAKKQDQKELEEKFKNFPDEYFEEEVVADGIGEMIRDLNLAHTLAMKMSHPLLAYLHEILMKIKRAFYDTPYTETINQVIRSIEQAYVKAANGTFESSPSGERLSLRDKEVNEASDKFDEELQQQIDGKQEKGHIYNVGMPSPVLLSTGVPNLPIHLNAARLKVKATKFGHDFDLKDIKGFVKAIQNPIAVFAYGDKEKAQNIILEISKDGKNFIVGLSLNPLVGGKHLYINSIRNVFPKNNSEWLNWISQGKALYLDKEKIQTLIDQQRTNLADVEYLNLDSVAKITNEFENPTIEGEDLTNNNENVKYSLRQKEVNEANERFNNEIEDFKNKSHKGLMHLGSPSPILRASGVNVSEITLSPKVLNKKLNQHSITTDDVKDLVKAIQNPIMVYKHGKAKPNIVVITNAEIRGNKLSIALELDAEGNVTELNNVSSIHDKDADKEVERLLDFTPEEFKEAMKWCDKEKVLDWISSAHLFSHMQTENSQGLSLAKVINDFENPTVEDNDLTNDNENVQFSLRQKEEPKKKGIGYKVFVLKDGKLYPPMVANPNGAATPVGVWLDADAAPIAGESKTGRPQVKQGGKGTQGGSGKLAYRPGWHLGVIPYAIQFNRKDAEGNKSLFPKNFVFAEVEYAADVDYQDEARKEGINPSGKYQHSLAGLKHLPTDGYYMYRTNPNPETDPWVITGAMKVNRILTRAEQADLVKKAGREPQMIQEGDVVTDEIVNAINQEIANAPKFSLKVYHGSGADFTEFDFDHMGEGAGSQAFGWGGYVTSSKKIGKSYATLMDNDPSRSHVVIRNGSARRFIKKYPTLESFLHSLADKDNLTSQENTINKHFTEQEKIDYYNERAKDAEPYHNMYEVEIPDDNGKNYLEWDKPLNKMQRSKIESYLSSQGIDLDEFAKKGFKMDMPYQYIHHVSIPMMLRSKGVIMENIPKEISKLMSSLGFTGIKYPAGTIMGGAEEGDTNYVIFRPEDMKITEHTKFSLKTYHGSQASFDHFDHSFMGSGEGAQAYGWGTYVSEMKGIAKAYANQNARKRSNESSKVIEQATENYKSAKRDVDDTQYDLNITKDLLKQFQDKLDNAKKNNRQNWIKEFEQRVQSCKEDIVNMEKNLKKYNEILAEKQKELDEAKSKSYNYFDVERELSDTKSGLEYAQNELEDSRNNASLMEKRLKEAKEELEKAKESETGFGVDMYEDDVTYYRNKVDEYNKKSKTLENDVNDIKDKVDALQKKLDSMEKPRNLYTVEIPDDTGDNYLGWDEPLTEKQKRMWKEAAVSLAPKGDEKMYEGETDKLLERYKKHPLTGEKSYKYLTANNTPKDVSLALKDAGFDGVKVIAQRNTGGNNDGRMNYVIFDENNAKIVDHEKFSLKTVKPVGKNEFGDVYDQFRDKPKEAFEFLLKNKSGYLRGVFHRDEIGDIDLAYGDAPTDYSGKGLAHIFRKHVELMNDFNSVDDAVKVITDVVTNGDVSPLNKNNVYEINKDGYRVSIAKDKNGNWVLSAMDKSRSKKEKMVEKSKKGAATIVPPSLPNDGAGAVAPNLSAAKIGNNSETAKENGEKFSLKDEDKTMVGVHNISQDKLMKAIKQGGLANPSVAVIDSSKQQHKGFGEISLIMPSSNIAKRTGRNAGTWQGDAWTPTYPQVERQMDDKGSEKAVEDVQSVPRDFQSAVRRDIDRWLDNNSGNSGMAYLFLHEMGKAPQMKKTDSKYDEKVYDELRFITAGDFNIFGIGEADTKKVLDMYIDARYGGDRAAYEQHMKEWLDKNKAYFEKGTAAGLRYTMAKDNLESYDKYGFNFKSVQNFVRDVAYDHKVGGKNDVDGTLKAADDYIMEHGLHDDFSKWMDGKEKLYGVKEVIFDGFTPSGKRRYVANTLENVSKIMKKQGRNGSSSISYSFNNFAAKLMNSYGKLDDIRSKKGLLTSNHEDLDKFRDKWGDVFLELGKKCQPDSVNPFDDYGMERLSEAALKSDPQAYLKSEYNVDFSDKDLKRLNEMIKAIKEEYPAMYFETKFERPVTFDEFSAAVVPTTAQKEVKDALNDAGVPIFEYDIKKDGDRKRAFDEAINSKNDIKFSLRYDQYKSDLDKWKKDNGLSKDAQRPTIPLRNPGESAADFMKRMREYRRQMALWKTAPVYEAHLLTDGKAMGEFNRELQKGSILARIALQDSMLAIRKAQEAIMREHGIDSISMAEDAYTAENRSHGKGKNELEEYNDEFLQPLRKAYNAMRKLLDNSYDNVKVYMMAKHGLERNAQIAFREALRNDFEDAAQRMAAYNAYKADLGRMRNDVDLMKGTINYITWRQRDNAIRTKYAPSFMDYRYDKMGVVMDYSGLSTLFEGATDTEQAAHDLVTDVEGKAPVETGRLWDATNAATKKILRDSYKAGMMSKANYEYVRDMYNNYIPLRGWQDTNADQVWDYIGGGKGAFNQALRTAEGRTSVADDPIAYIENMAESGILINNKNWVKQHLMLLAQNHPTSLLTLSKAWYVKSTDAQGNETWIPASPNITSGMTAQQVRAAIDAFEKNMEQKKQNGEATQQRGNLEITYPQTNGQKHEHEVRVMKDGEEYVVYVNGDPQLAQAMNNTRAHRVREVQSGKIDRICAFVGRKMAAVYTSLSPLFIPSNYFRDLTMTLASTAIREDGRYNYLLRKNLVTSWGMWGLLNRYKNGTLREKVRNGNATEKEQMFYDFMMNGGETGFVSSFDIEDLKKKFKSELRDMNRSYANPKKVGHVIMDSIEFMNRAIENSNRFAIYMTSIQYGRSIEEAVNNAKDVTLNFNRKGTGEYGWQTFRNLYLFINPAIQSLQTLGALGKHHTFKFTAVTTTWLLSGLLMPLMNAAMMKVINLMTGAFGGDDDKYKDIEEKYWQFSKWDRRNNMIMWIPFTKAFVKIPLAQEFRGFYGVGDMIASKLMGGETAQESWKQYAYDFLGQVIDMLPIDPTGYDGNMFVSLMPNAARPIFELAFNVDFTGKPLFNDTEYNKYDPNFTKAYAGTPDWLVRVSKMVNSIGNDYPDVQQNSIDSFGNPRLNLNNPAVVDHVLSSYLGGAYTMGSQVIGALTKSLNDPKEIKMADIPLFSKFVSNPDDRPQSKKQGDDYWETKENHDRAANTISKLKKQARLDGDYSLLKQFYGSKDYEDYKLADVKVKQYKEDKKKKQAEDTGEEYFPHKLTADDVYRKHATAMDDFEDMKLKQIYSKLYPFMDAYELFKNTAPKQADGYYKQHKTAIDAIAAIKIKKELMSDLKSYFLDEDGEEKFDEEKMDKIRKYRNDILPILENANKILINEQKQKVEAKDK